MKLYGRPGDRFGKIAFERAACWTGELDRPTRRHVPGHAAAGRRPTIAPRRSSASETSRWRCPPALVGCPRRLGDGQDCDRFPQWGEFGVGHQNRSGLTVAGDVDVFLRVGDRSDLLGKAGLRISTGQHLRHGPNFSQFSPSPTDINVGPSRSATENPRRARRIGASGPR